MSLLFLNEIKLAIRAQPYIPNYKTSQINKKVDYGQPCLTPHFMLNLWEVSKLKE